MRFVGVLLVSVLVTVARAQSVSPETLPQGFVLIVKDKSGLSSTESPLYLASNWGGWAPGDGAYKLSARSDMRWQIIVKPTVKDPPPLEFKITRGSWEMCEVSADLADVSNRRLPKVDVSGLAPGQQPTVEIEVEKFSDQRPDAQAKKAVSPYRSIQAVGTVKRLSVIGGGVPGLFRDALVWLPPGYDDVANIAKRYPVLYLHDGQNIFEQIPGVPGEWKADETATELIAAGKIEPLIIVGIPHAGSHRIAEYLPVAGVGEVKPGGDEYVRFLIQEVVPRVERTFRAAPGAESRAIGGSSLGGLISLYAAAKHPEVFGLVLAESPSLSLARRDLGQELFGGVTKWPGRVYLGVGGKETSDATASEAYMKAVIAMDARLEAAGVSAAQRKLVVAPEAVHNEVAWAERFGAALEFLFPAK